MNITPWLMYAPGDTHIGNNFPFIDFSFNSQESQLHILSTDHSQIRRPPFIDFIKSFP